jgi:hypothetical protein
LARRFITFLLFFFLYCSHPSHTPTATAAAAKAEGYQAIILFVE